MQERTPKASTNRISRVLAVLAVCFLVLACVSNIEYDLDPRQGWWEGNGIVVPHDSFPSDCRLCHVEGSWNEIREDFEYDHEQETGVALVGAHREAKCLRCHNDRGPVQLFSQRGCAGCHEDLHRGNFGDQCVSCHSEETWILRDEIAVHNRTRFPLVGAHAAVQCWLCHSGGEVGDWVRLDIECASCHLEEALAATDPDHAANRWVTGCDRCHIPTTWNGAGFNHFAFPLTGAHASADCGACHVGGVFTGLPTDCAGCHSQEYQQANDPDHVAGGFSMSCELCHDTSSWDGAMFNHASINSGCAVCHQDDFNATTNPNHLAAGVSQTCEMCHGVNNWSPANMTHAGITTNCAVCHITEYNQTTMPGHAAAGFPTTCEACHGTAGWTPASFNHSFPITSGDHGGFDCADCHTTPGNYQAFSCIHCHEHRQSKMADKHSGESGYSWNSNACLGCHPTGQD